MHVKIQLSYNITNMLKKLTLISIIAASILLYTKNYSLTSLPSSPSSTSMSAFPTPLNALPTPFNCNSLTPSQTEGPYYKAGSPQRTSLVDTSTIGSKLNLSGYVFDSACRPVAAAWLDFWQADSSGAYDNVDFRLRGHQLTDANGYYSLQTIAPGLYTGRTPHIHVKVKRPEGPVLTTQLYLPASPQNTSDSLYNSNLVMKTENDDTGINATFNFIIQ